MRPSGGAFASAFPPIADLGFLSDCHTGALVTSDGSIEWMCVPHFDSPSVFAALLDRGAGSWRVGPYGVFVPAGRRYLPGTNMIETTWMTPQGWVRVLDALTIGVWHDNKRGSSHTRPPTDYDADHLLVRLIECLQGQVQVEIVCEPMLDYGARPAVWEAVEGGPTGLSILDAGDGDGDSETSIRLFSDIRMGIEGNRSHGRHTLTKGEKRYCALSWTEARGGPYTVEQAEQRLEATAQFWRGWLAEGTYPDHPWRIHLERSALALKGLTFMPTGALLAAATTSLPETPGGERNWDYRYCWMRDATFTLWALHALDLDWEADDFIQYVADMDPRRGRGAADHVRDRRPTSISPSRRSITSAATREPARYGSATAPTSSARTTSSAPCSTPCTYTPRSATTSPSACGRCSPTRSVVPRRPGASPTRGSGRRAASPATTSPRS